MVTLKAPRLKTCAHPNCQALGLANDDKCLSHTSENRYNKPWTLTVDKPMKNPFGMELECVGPMDIRLASKCVTGDGSLGDRGHEIKILAESSVVGVRAATAARKARLLGAKVNSKCGFHVHMSLPKDSSGPNWYSVRPHNAITLTPIVMAIQNEVRNLFPSRKDNYYCAPVRDSMQMREHYSWLSISSGQPTIECRIHPGTLNSAKIIAWGQVCVGLQKIFHNVLLGVETESTKRARDGEFIRLFRKGTIARHYLEARSEAVKIGGLKNYKLP